MNIFKATFYKYEPMMLDEYSELISETENSKYLFQTRSLAENHHIELCPLVGKYRGSLYLFLYSLKLLIVELGHKKTLTKK